MNVYKTTPTNNTPNSQINNNRQREDSIYSLLNCDLEINFDVLRPNDFTGYANGDDVELDKLYQIAIFSNYKLTTNRGKHLEDSILAQVVSLMYKPITSTKDINDLSIGFHRDLVIKRTELINNKNQNGDYCVGIMLRDVFGFAEHQQEATYGLGYRLAITRKFKEAALNKAEPIANVKVLINSRDWLVPLYKPCMGQEVIKTHQGLSNAHKELQ